MPNCAILNCKNSSKTVGRVNGDISFHRFPNEPYLKEKWIDATGNKNWFPTKYSTICSIHFDEASLAGSEKNRRLIKTAYPTIQILTDTLTAIKEEPCTSNEMPLNTQRKKNIVIKLEHAKQKLKQQHLMIKRLREQNRRKMKKIRTLGALLDCLKKNSLVAQAE